MRRKSVAVMTVIAILAGLLACGSRDVVSQEVVEIMEEATSEETISEEKENTPIWYMDEEGVKSEPFGIKIRRDSAKWESFGISGRFGVGISDQDPADCKIVSIPFACTYYEGDSSLFDEFTFAGNGISFSIFMPSGYDIEDIWEHGLSSYEEEHEDYLAYIRGNTLYCPALDIKFSRSDDIINIVGVAASDESGSIEISMEISNGLAFGTVEERFDQFTATRENYGETAIDETIEKSLGKHQFTGKGFANSDGGELWAFFSNETANSIYISIINKDERKVEDYLSLIEELQ